MAGKNNDDLVGYISPESLLETGLDIIAHFDKMEPYECTFRAPPLATVLSGPAENRTVKANDQEPGSNAPKDHLSRSDEAYDGFHVERSFHRRNIILDSGSDEPEDEYEDVYLEEQLERVSLSAQAIIERLDAQSRTQPPDDGCMRLFVVICCALFVLLVVWLGCCELERLEAEAALVLSNQ